MKVIYSIAVFILAIALQAFSMPVPAFSEMMDMHHGQMIGMDNMDKMGEM